MELEVESIEDKAPLPALSAARLWTRWERKFWLGALFCGCAIAYAARAVMPLCVVEVSSEYGWNKTEAGTVLSAFFWGYSTTQVIGGYLSDRFGAELVMTYAMVGWSCITIFTPVFLRLLQSWSHSSRIHAFIVLRILTGCVQGVHFPSLNSMLSRRIASSERALSLSIATSGSHFGTLAIGVFGSFLLENFGWTYPFYLVGLVGLTWVLCIWQTCLASSQSIKVLPVSASSKLEVLSVPWGLLFRKFPFWAIVIGQFCGSWVFYILFSWLPTFFTETFPNEKGWVFNAVPWLVPIPFQWFSGWWADHLISEGYSTIFARKLIQTLSFCGAAVCLFLMSIFGTNYYGALFFMSTSMAFCAFHHSGVIVNVQDIAPKYAGSVFGLINTAGAIPGFVGVYVAGYLLQVSGSWSIVFNSTAFVCLFGSVVFLFGASAEKIV